MTERPGADGSAMKVQEPTGLADLEVYRLARQLGSACWAVYGSLGREERWLVGMQFIQAIDSIAANIAEGYGRFHYMDSVKFYYNARGSLWESVHWIGVLAERGLLDAEEARTLRRLQDNLSVKLNNFISSVKTRARKAPSPAK